MTTESNGNRAPSTGTGIYVDTENLREPDLAQDVIEQTIANWPVEYPAISSVSLYVRADKVALWRMWVEATYPDLKVRVRGVQHFSREMAKNSADLAITADAIGDLAAGLATFIGVISNDSDFGALFVKVREMASEQRLGSLAVPVGHRAGRRRNLAGNRTVHPRPVSLEPGNAGPTEPGNGSIPISDSDTGAGSRCGTNPNNGSDPNDRNGSNYRSESGCAASAKTDRRVADARASHWNGDSSVAVDSASQRRRDRR